MTAESLARALSLRRVGRDWRGACPVHGGTSFTVTEKAGKPMFYCWSGCDRGAILDELKRRGLWPDSDLTPEAKRDFAKQRARDTTDLKDAKMFADAAHILAEQCLEGMSPADAQRGPLTQLLAALRTDAGTLAEYRDWRQREEKLTAGLVEAGRKHQERLEMMLSNYLMMEASRAA